MHRPHPGTLMVLLTLHLAGCQPLTVDVPPASPSAAAVTVPLPSPAILPPSPLPERPAMTVQAVFQGHPLVGATISVRRVQDLAIVSNGLTTDADGLTTVPLPTDTSPDTAVLVTAVSDQTTLSGLFLVSSPPASAWSLDLATTLVARRLTSKVAEVVRSTPATVRPIDRLGPLFQDLQGLCERVRTELAGPQQDDRVARACQETIATPTLERIEALATAMIRYSGLRSVFTSAVGHCNRLVVEGLINGGPLVQAALWQMAEVVVTPPRMYLADGTRIRIVWESRVADVAVTHGTETLNTAMAASVATPENAAYAAVNTTFVPPPLVSGGGGSAPVVAVPVPPRRVLFVSNRTGNSDVFVMNLDGSGQTNLSNNPATDMQPEASPDGSKIAFVSNRTGLNEIYVINVDGSNLTNLTNTGDGNNIAPTWSPDGSKIVFASTRNGAISGDIYVMNADGSGQTNISNAPLVQNHSYVWSPDSTRLAFTSTRDGNQEMYVMNADGSNVNRLTTHAANDYVASWSPDGSRIGFISNRNGNYRLYTVKPDGSDLLTLTPDGAFSWLINWSPDSAKIVFRSNRDGNTELYTMNADGSQQTNVTNDPGTDDISLHSWSHDGSKILFLSSRDGNQEIYLMNTDGSQQTNLTNDPGTDSAPRFMR